MRGLLMIVAGFAAVASVAAYAADRMTAVPDTPPAVASPAPEPPESAVVTITGGTTSSLSIPISTFTTTTAVYVSSGTYAIVANNYSVATVAPPKLSITCDAESCSARGWTGSMEDAKAMLERIAQRQMRIEVTVDQKCHPQRETIEPRPDLVADAR
jgi:hypothetical protein